MMKEREYGDRVWKIEGLYYFPGFSATGGMGKKATIFYHQLADLLASKHGWTYSTTLSLGPLCVCLFCCSLLLCAYGTNTSLSSADISPMHCHECQINFKFCWITSDDTFT